MNPDATSAGRESAPYGKACAGCSKAKCRCIPRGRGLSCERCHRLRKECQPSAVVRKRLARKPAPRTAQLEEKLDDLVGLLRSQASVGPRAPNGLGISVQAETSEDGSRSNGAGTSDGGPTEQREHQRVAHHVGPATEKWPGPSPYYLTPQTMDSPVPPEPPSEAEHYLKTFRDVHLRTFPFIYISPETTAAQIQHQWPVFWLSIRASCCKSTQKQLALERKFRQVVAQKMLVDLERSMDMLFGLITFLSWAWEKYRGKPLLNVFSNLLGSLLSDLRLDRHVQELPCREVNVSRAYSVPIKHAVPAINRSNEERRAVLGCFIVTSGISWFLKTPLTSRWIPYMEDCIQHLTQNPGTPDDEILVAMARILKIIDDTGPVTPWRVSESESPQPPQVPPMLLVKGLRANIEEIRRTTSQETLSNKIITSYMTLTEAMVNELPLYSSEQHATVAPGLADFGKTECFYACLKALKQCLDNFYTITPDEVHGLHMSMHLHFSRCTHMLYRLSLMDDPAWDRAAISNTVDLMGAVEWCAELYSKVPSAIGLETDGTDIYTRASEVLRSTVPMWKRSFEEAGVVPGRRAQAEAEAEVEAEAEAEAEVANAVVDQGDMTAAMDFTFDGWFTDSFPLFDTF